MQRGTETMADPLHTALFGLKIKGTARTHQHAPGVCPLFGSFRDDCSRQIACLKAVNLFRPFGLGAGEPDVIDIALLPTPMSFGGDHQRNDPCQAELCWGTASRTGCVDPMGFGQSSPDPIELRQSTRAPFHPQSERLQ